MNDVREFGACPICGCSDGYLNVGRDHWFVCHRHKVKWHFGSNIFSAWREEDPAEHEDNERQLAPYREVEPIYIVALAGGAA